MSDAIFEAGSRGKATARAAAPAERGDRAAAAVPGVR